MLSQLIKSIVTLTGAALPFWILFRIIILSKRFQRSVSLKRELILGLCFLYVIFVLAITVVPTPVSQFRDPTARDLNVVPVINTAKEFIANLSPKRNYMLGHSLENILGNIILFVPLGIFLPLLSARFYSLKKVLITAFFCSLSIEVIQYISVFWRSYRSVDIDDIILNTLGAFLGFIIYDKLLSKAFKAQKEITEI
jgi:glycopeptide antibiotics resistance protein